MSCCVSFFGDFVLGQVGELGRSKMVEANFLDRALWLRGGNGGGERRLKFWLDVALCKISDKADGLILELSLTVPITNSLAFLFTVFGDWYVDRKVISRGKFSPEI